MKGYSMETNQMPLIIGIDLCSEFSQVSYYNFKDKEPVSIDFPGLDTRFQVPTCVSKSIGKEEWFAGDEADKGAVIGEAVLVKDLLKKAIDKNPVGVDDVTIMPIDLLKIFLDYLIQAAKIAGKSDRIEKICITVEVFHISLLNVLAKALASLGIGREQILFSSHVESFIYYALSQKQELWTSDVMLFDYGPKGFFAHRLYIVNERGTRIVMVHTDSFSQEIPYSLMEHSDRAELLDQRLTQMATQVLDRKLVGTAYLTGDGFGDEIKNTEFIKVLCNRRRVFAGHNLYCKGACYQAYEVLYGTRFKDLLLACPERITTGIEMKISDRGRDKILRIIRPGMNWFGADYALDFIVDDMDEVELFLSPVDAREKQVVKISLSDFPTRPNKTTRIGISFSFTSDARCHLMVKDKGFGEFFTSSGRIINEELLL